MSQQPGNYNNFTVAVYARAYEVREMADLQKLETTWNKITGQLKVGKIYLETHRDKIIVDEKTLTAAKKFFTSRGIRVAGGITYTMDESNHFETFCYSNPEHRQKAREIAEYTARHFDEFILDDFFFTSCKCDLCIKAKGDLSWTDYRLKLMTGAARELIIDPAKAVNPKVKVVIKYPNWYEHFQGLGFNLETEPGMFDGIYTGTETRDPVITAQHLQQYEGYLIFRYFENIAPGRNGGGWVDPFASINIDRYAEQLWLTIFAKAPEITLFDYRQIQTAVRPELRASWQDANVKLPATYADAAGQTFEQVDHFVHKLGNPVGIKSYRPFHATGEDFLQNYLGMIGIPMDIQPTFPADSKNIILTESARFDPQIVEKIKERLQSGKNVMITSGLLRALQGKGIEDIVELRYTDRKALVNNFMTGWGPFVQSKDAILIPVIDYLTNDSWEDISAVSGSSGWPILHMAQYSKAYLYILTIPDNFSELYRFPAEVLNRIRAIVTQDVPVRLEGPSQVSLFCYDNGTFIVESFLPEPVTVKVAVTGKVKGLTDMVSGESLTGTAGNTPFIWGRDRSACKMFEIALKPHSYRVFETK
ncbi:MAG: hypothetical protein JW830_02990 [Bacteroidales bacterium]|nr:hypothetical protein [Bacteroidales bacterium]